MNDSFNPAELGRRDTERLKRYRDLLDFYHGRHWEGRERRNEKRLTFNYARVFIDKITSYLMSGIHPVVEPLESTERSVTGAERAEALLRKVYEANDLEQLDFETEIDCAILGDACYKVTWDREADCPRITSPDIQGIHAWREGDDPAKVRRVASVYDLDREEAERLHGITPKNKTASVTEIWTDAGFELWIDGVRTEAKPNPYGFIPFIIYPNIREPKRFWGVSDLAQIIEPQQELNRATSQLSKILELSGNPIAVLENIEESEDIAVRPGAVWNIPEDAKAYLLDLLQGGGVRMHIDYINLLYRILHDLSESPRAAFGGTERDLSGIALEIELQPLLQKVRRKRLIRSTVYNRRNRLILRLAEQFRNEDFGSCRPDIIWGPVLPTDFNGLVANEQVLIQNGIHSRRRAMDEIGVIDPEKEFDRWLEERERILRMNRELGPGTARSATRGRAAEPRTDLPGEPGA